MKHKIRIYLILLTLLAMLASTAAGVYLSYNSLLKQTREMLRSEISLLNDASDIEGRRITRISSDGQVTYDSDVSSAEMDNHSNRPEFIQAINSGEGFSVRHSETLNYVTLYYAMRMDDGSVLRISVLTDSVWSVLKDTLPVAVIIMFILVIAVIILTDWLTKRIVQPMEASLKDADIFKPVYDELIPFFTLLEDKNIRIREMLDDLTQKQQEMELITSNMNEGMLFIDAKGIVQFANPAAFRLFGIEAYHIEGRDYIYFSNHKKLEKAVKKAEHGKIYSKDIKLEQGKVLQLSSAPVQGSDGYSGVICVFSDVTEQRKVDKIRRDFTANVSHELKTPLTSIMGYSELIAGGIENRDEIQRFAAIIQKESQHLLTLIGNILKLSELEGSEKTQLEEFDLLQLAQECALSLELYAENRNVSVSLEGESYMISSDKAMLRHMLTNLIDNAIRYNVESGKVSVKVLPGSVTVEDTGIGIPNEDKQRIFERFYRADKGRCKNSGGTGLGLAIVKHIAERVDATITLSSEANKGTCVKVDFRL